MTKFVILFVLLANVVAWFGLGYAAVYSSEKLTTYHTAKK